MHRVTSETIISGQISHDRSLREKTTVTKILLEMPANKTLSLSDENYITQEHWRELWAVVEKYAELSWPTLLETFTAFRVVEGMSNWPLFIFQLLHSVHLGIFMMVKECTVA